MAIKSMIVANLVIELEVDDEQMKDWAETEVTRSLRATAEAIGGRCRRATATLVDLTIP